MIKCEVVFDGDKLEIGRHWIVLDEDNTGLWEAYHYDLDICCVKRFNNLEQAIKYCMEN